jgi:hypothetical protein
MNDTINFTKLIDELKEKIHAQHKPEVSKALDSFQLEMEKIQILSESLYKGLVVNNPEFNLFHEESMSIFPTKRAEIIWSEKGIRLIPSESEFVFNFTPGRFSVIESETGDVFFEMVVNDELLDIHF